MRQKIFSGIILVVLVIAAVMYSVPGGTSTARADDWTKIAENGISGDYYYPQDVITSMAVYGTDLYIGTHCGTVGFGVYKYDGTNTTRIGSYGVGNESNWEAGSMAVYNGKLYVGGGRAWNSETGAPLFSWDGTSWETVTNNAFGRTNVSTFQSMAVVGGLLYLGGYNPINGCEVFSFDGTSATKIGDGGLGDNWNYGATAMAEHGGDLYVGTKNNNGSRLYRWDDPDWTALGTPGFGDEANQDVMCMLSMEDHGEPNNLYLGTYHDPDTCRIVQYNSSTGTFDDTWMDDGFGNPSNVLTTSMVYFDGNMYAATSNDEGGTGVYRWDDPDWTQVNEPGYERWSQTDVLAEYDSNLYSGASGNGQFCGFLKYDGGTDWTQIGQQGFVGGHFNSYAPSFTGYQGKLLTGTSSEMGNGEIWQRDGSTWSGLMTDGFGQGFMENESVGQLCEYKGKLYAGTSRFARVFRYDGGTTWTQVNEDNFVPGTNNKIINSMLELDGYLYASTSTNNGNSGEVWRYDGTNWVKINQTGFGQQSVIGAYLAVHNGMLYAGTESPGSYRAAVFRYDGGTNWTRVSTYGFGGNGNISALASFNGNLYALGEFNLNLGEPEANPRACVWKWNGSDVQGWSRASELGFDEGVNFIYSAAVFNGKLFSGASGCRIWSYDGKGWSKANDPGFGEASNNGNVSLYADGNNLYAGTNNQDYGAQVWKTSAPALRIDRLDPESGTAGSQLTIEGSGFGATRGDSYVTFGGARIEDYISWSEGEIEITVPPSGSGTQKVSVTTPAGTSNEVDFELVAPEWYLPEGSSAWGFDTYVTVTNPNDDRVRVQFTYMTGDGPVNGGIFTMQPESQLTVNPGGIVPDRDFSTHVECLEGETIAVDRTMSWASESHSSIGVTAPAEKWYLPEGCSGYGFETWLLLQNPNDQQATCSVTYMVEGGEPVTVEQNLPPNTRQTLNMADAVGEASASIEVTSDIPVIPERSMYRYNRMEGHDSIGTVSAGSDYYLAEGSTAWGYETWILVQNPNDEQVQVEIAFHSSEGEVEHPDLNPVNMPPDSRMTIKASDYLPGADFSTLVRGSMPIVAERAMYWNAGTKEACHDSIGLPAPHETFYLPDGQSSDGRTTWTLVQNPNDSAVTIVVSYFTATGQGNVAFTDTLPANTRRTYNMAGWINSGRASIEVDCADPIVVERSMYWNDLMFGTNTVGAGSD